MAGRVRTCAAARGCRWLSAAAVVGGNATRPWLGGYGHRVTGAERPSPRPPSATGVGRSLRGTAPGQYPLSHGRAGWLLASAPDSRMPRAWIAPGSRAHRAQLVQPLVERPHRVSTRPAMGGRDGWLPRRSKHSTPERWRRQSVRCCFRHPLPGRSLPWPSSVYAATAATSSAVQAYFVLPCAAQTDCSAETNPAARSARVV